ncbi:MAG: acetyl-CoA C-acetyltransferase [Gammaproteobacteria bacterium]|nr:acetyl-CoA C-acetyltransferase [Gammaproteobacteria bacterium]MDE2252316.1 acetyl-CoA C-acetyltransferase [Gammaproteobacteria bacterium]
MLTLAAPRRVAIVGGTRIPFARSHGAYAGQGNQELLTAALRALVERYRLQGQRLGDVIGGAVIKHSRDFNLVREALMSTGLDPQTPGLDIQRACGTGLEAAILIANKIALGQIDAGIACGVDTVSDPPVVFPNSFRELLLKSYRGRSFGQRFAPWLKLRPRDLKPILPAVIEPRTGLSMGQSCELMARTWNISRADQDRIACESHLKAAAAWQAGFYDDLVVPHAGLARDNNVRPDTTVEKLGTLRPVFDTTGTGTLTAGNSTPLTDGAAAVLLATEEWARAQQLPVLAWLRAGKSWAVDFASGKEGLLMAPAYAMSAMLADVQLALQDFDYYELHEAFAAQLLCTLRAWESPQFCRERLGRSAPLGAIDPAKLNVKGGSVALGHPFAATGGRILASLAKLLANDAQARRGVISVCTAGGMGVTAIVERA